MQIAYNPENEKLISWVKFIMVCGGFWNLPLTNHYFIEKLFSVYSVIMRSGCVMFWVLIVSELIRLIIFNYELQILITAFSVVVNVSKIFIKLIIYTKHNILELFKEVIEKEEEVWASNDENIKTMYRGKIRTLKIYTAALTGFTMTAVILLQGFGAVGVLQIREHNKKFNTSLEAHTMYETIIPLNKLEHITSLFALETFLAWIATPYNCGTHLIFVVVLMFSASQLEILQIRLQYYVEEDFPEEPTEEQINEKVVLLKSFIRDHNYIIRFVQHFNNCTKNIVMAEFCLASLDLACVSANLTKKVGFSDLGWLVFFFGLLGIQLYLIGWNCNEIKIQSVAIADATYASKWYLLNKEAKQLTQIIIARAQRPLLMTIGPFGPMTTTSALTVIKVAYSYVSVMMK